MWKARAEIATEGPGRHERAAKWRNIAITLRTPTRQAGVLLRFPTDLALNRLFCQTHRFVD